MCNSRDTWHFLLKAYGKDKFPDPYLDELLGDLDKAFDEGNQELADLRGQIIFQYLAKRDYK